MRNMQNCEMPKNDIFSQVRGHEKLQSFRLSEKAFKMMKTITNWPQDTWNVNICSFGWKICEDVKCPKTTFFRRSALMKIFKIFHFLESLLKWWKSPPVDLRTLEMLIFDHLNEKYAKMWNGNWRLIMKYFLRSFFPSADSRRAVVSFSERMCTILVNRLED